VEGARKAEILDAAAKVFGTSGLRASLQDVAEACGILPGSLYHHFDSKEDIFIELVRRYQSELDEIAATATDRRRAGAGSPLEQAVAFGTAIAACAIRHRAALLLTFYEPPAGSSEALQMLARRTPTAITAAMLAMLQAARSNGDLRPEVDAAVLADRMCQSMLHVGIGVYHRTRGAERRPALQCDMLLHGLAVRAPNDARLNRSHASRVADELIKAWNDDGREQVDDKVAAIRAVARAEFARRGYELTTIRHVAAAAGFSTGTVYRLIDSKADLLVSIMQSYAEEVTRGWSRIVSARATAVEKLDALLWFNINATERFGEEQRIQMAGLQQFPPSTPDLPMTFPTQLRQLKSLLSEGMRASTLQLGGASLDMGARCLFTLVWTPENIVRDAGARGALQAARESVLRGAATPDAPA
jgi:AcrR family transcriptional regulator